jgi:hypothetical protein
MDKDELLLSSNDMRNLLNRGMAPQFDSLARLLNDAAKFGAMRWYRDNEHGSLSDRNRNYQNVEVKHRLTDTQNKQLIEIMVKCTGEAFQMAARMGYQNVEYK